MKPLCLIGKHCCALHTTADCWCATWGRTFPQAYRWHNLVNYIRIVKWTHSTSTNFSIRQCSTAEQTDEVEFLDVNHCITTDDNFGFVTKDFVKPTAEGRHFINNIQVNLIWRSNKIEASQPKERGLPSSLNRLKGKVVHSNLPLTMTNDMIAVAGKKIGKKSYGPKMWQERWHTGLGYIFPLPANSNTERKKLNPKAMVTFKRPITTRQILTNYKHVALSKTKKHVKAMSGPCNHYALCGCHGKQQISGTMCSTNNEWN